MEKKSAAKKTEKRPTRRANGVGFFHEFNPGQTELLYSLAVEHEEIEVETVSQGTTPNCRFETSAPEFEAYVTFQLEQLKQRQEWLETLFALPAA